jgi:hypothetical protein
MGDKGSKDKGKRSKHAILSGGLATATGRRRWLSSSMQEADELPSASLSECTRCLNWLDVFGTWPFRSTSVGICHSLSFLELFECHSIEVRRVEEQILFGPGVYKSKTSVRQPLDRAFCHFKVIFLKKTCLCGVA